MLRAEYCRFRSGVFALGFCVFIAARRFLYGLPVLSGQLGLRFQFRAFQVFLGRRGLLMPVVVVVIARSAAHLGGLPTHERNNGVIGNAAAFNAVIVYHVT